MTSAAAPSRPSIRRQTIVLTVALLIAVALVQVWIVTAGLHNWPQGTDYISRQATAYLHGQTNLTTHPPRDLLALPNPFDPGKNFKMILYDVLLFDRKYYLYWGPTPALLTAAICLPLGVLTPDFGDEYVTFAFVLGTTILTAVLMLRIKMRWFSQLPPWTLAAPILSFGLSAPVLYALARPHVYEAMIAGGQFFLLAGFCLILRGIDDEEKASTMRLLAAGICWAISIGARVSLLPGVAAAEAVVIWRMRRSGARLAWLSLTVPLIAAVILLGWYNFIRFGSITEFGLRWQLAGRDQHEAPFSAFFSLLHVPANALRYVFVGPDWEHGFPFIRAGRRPAWSGMPFDWSDTLYYDPLIGLLWAQPFLLFALAARRANISPRIAVVIFATAAAAFLPDLVFQWSAMRYLLDILPCCSILAAVGYWNVLARRDHHRGRIQWLAAALVAGQIAIALLMGITGMYDNFKTHNLPLYNAMKSLLGG
jgi:hypothetical protein